MSRIHQVALLAALAVLWWVAVPSALGGNTYWIGGTGNWSEGSNWNAGEPTSSDDAYIQNGGTAQIAAGNTEYADDLYISSASRLEIHGGTLNMLKGGSCQFIGYAAGTTGTVVQYGGQNSVGYHLYLGDGAGSSGYYTLNGGNLYVDNNLYVGYNGLGVFQQSAGTVNVVGRLRLGDNSYSSGTYRLSGTGQLTVQSSYGIEVGVQDGAGRLEWFREGGITADKIKIGDLGTLAMGYDFSAVPALVTDLHLGTLEVTNGATVTKTDDGVTSQVKYLRIGSATGAGYGIQTGGVVQVGQTVYIGDGGAGVATQHGGTFTTTVHLYLGLGGAEGAYRLRGGTLNVNSNIFGGTGTGTIVLDGGTLNHGGTIFNVTNLILGDEAGRTGSYTLTAGKTLTVTNQDVGRNGTGIFTQSGGTANVTNLRFATQASGAGSYLLTGGTLNVSGQVFDGSGTGTLQVDGGTFNPSGTVAVDHLKVGITAAGSHIQTANAYNVGTLTLGNATYHLRGGSLVVGGVANTTGTGTLNIDGGAFSPAGAVNVDNLGVGVHYAGAHTQTDQTYTVGTLTLGAGAYTLSGGTLAVTGHVVNGTGTGTLALNGGAFGPSGTVDVDHLHVGVTGAADHTLAAGTWWAGSMTLGVQGGGSGAFTLAGGTLNVAGDIATGAGSGTLVLNGGTLSLGGNLAVTDLKVGVDAVAAYVQSSKTFDVSGDLTVGSGAAGSGTYRLDGTGLLQVGHTVYVGAAGGAGRFEWYRTGGLTASGGIDLGPAGTLAMGHDFDADALAAAGGMVTGLDDATLEVTRGAAATQDADTVAVKALHLGSAAGGGTYRLQGTAELTISADGRLAVGTASDAGRFEWYRPGGLTTPRLVLASGGTLAMGFDFAVAELLDGSLFGGGTLLGIDQAALTITQDATATQAAGAFKVGTLQVGAAAAAGTYDLQDGDLRAGTLLVGVGGAGTLALGSAGKVYVSTALGWGRDATLSAPPGSRITLTGTDVWNHSTVPANLADLVHLTLAFQPEAELGITLSRMEVAGKDLGITMDGFVDNFALGTLIVGKPAGAAAYLHLVDDFFNQGPPGPDPKPEALYVHNLYVYPGATLDLNFLNVYYDGVLVADGSIINGTPQYVPEPATLALLALGAAGLVMRRRRRE